MKRLLVTGSRSWTDRDAIQSHLWDAFQDLAADDPDGDVTLIHGAAHGADRLAADIWDEWGLPAESYPADWTGPCALGCPSQHRKWNTRNQNYCPLAGHRRNAKMIALGADLCIAFILDGSRGATQCARLAEHAGIEVRRIEVSS